MDNASEDLKSLTDGPDTRIIVRSACNVKGARYRTVGWEKNLRTQNCGIMTKAVVGDQQESEFYGVMQEVLELQYEKKKHGDISVFLFRCDWFDLVMAVKYSHPRPHLNLILFIFRGNIFLNPTTND